LIILIPTIQLITCLPVENKISDVLLKHVNLKDNISICETCVKSVDVILAVLKAELIDINVVTNCIAVCNILRNEVIDAETFEVLCNILCGTIGIEAFVQDIFPGKMDSIYYCELLEACKENDNGDAKITHLIISPSQGPQGTFYFSLEYISKNGTGI
jgi:hypothetical protein